MPTKRRDPKVGDLVMLRWNIALFNESDYYADVRVGVLQSCTPAIIVSAIKHASVATVSYELAAPNVRGWRRLYPSELEVIT